MMSLYHHLADRHSPTPGRRFYQLGSASTSLLWRKLAQVHAACQRDNIPTVDFLKAQFEQWVPGRTGEPIPYPRRLGYTELALQRYGAWKAKRRSIVVADVERTEDVGNRILDAIKRRRPEATDESLLSDPFVLVMLPRDFVAGRPEFLAVRGQLAESALCRAMLGDLLQ